MTDLSETGLHNKYKVTRADGSSEAGGKHEHCSYFVLDLTHDNCSASALFAYAISCKDKNPGLSSQLNELACSIIDRVMSEQY